MEYTIDFLPKVKVETAAADEAAEKTMKTIADAARTDRIVVGRFFLLDLSGAGSDQDGRMRFESVVNSQPRGL